MDWFASPKLYRKLEHKLIGSYVTDALSEADGQPHPEPQATAAKQFLTDASKAKVKAETKSGAGRAYEFDGADIEGQMLLPSPTEAPVHRTYYKKK